MNTIRLLFRLGGWGISLLFLLLGQSALADTTKEINKQFDASGGEFLSLDTEFGDVEIISGGESRIEVNILMKARTNKESLAQEWFEDFEVEFEQEDGELYITGDYEKSHSSRFWQRPQTRRVWVKYSITVPAGLDITIRTAGGDIMAGDLDARVDLKTSGGDIQLERIKGDVKAGTSGGDILIGECTGSTDVRTSGGDILIRKAEGDVSARTSGGDISVEEVLGAVEASTSGGNVKAYIASQPQHDCSLTTSGGNVVVYLDEHVNLDLDAQASGGRVRADFKMKVNGKITKNAIRAELNDGGPELYLRTSGGRIDLNKI